jgi:hypothetical protein
LHNVVYQLDRNDFDRNKERAIIASQRPRKGFFLAAGIEFVLYNIVSLSFRWA